MKSTRKLLLSALMMFILVSIQCSQDPEPAADYSNFSLQKTEDDAGMTGRKLAMVELGEGMNFSVWEQDDELTSVFTYPNEQEERATSYQEIIDATPLLSSLYRTLAGNKISVPSMTALLKAEQTAQLKKQDDYKDTRSLNPETRAEQYAAAKTMACSPSTQFRNSYCKLDMSKRIYSECGATTKKGGIFYFVYIDEAIGGYVSPKAYSYKFVVKTAGIGATVNIQYYTSTGSLEYREKGAKVAKNTTKVFSRTLECGKESVYVNRLMYYGSVELDTEAGSCIDAVQYGAIWDGNKQADCGPALIGIDDPPKKPCPWYLILACG